MIALGVAIVAFATGLILSNPWVAIVGLIMAHYFQQGEVAFLDKHMHELFNGEIDENGEKTID